MACTSTYVFGFKDPELERRKEFERRKKLRLLQVREQSKEFADNLREKIKGEFSQQKKKYLEAESKLKQEKHVQELYQLKELYDRCLKSIGEGHKEAAKQPDLNLEKQAELVRTSTRASKRGAEAIKKQLEDEAVQKKKTEAPVKQKKAARNKENLRAFFISSLPKHGEKSGPLSVSPPKQSHQNTELQESRRVLEEIPSNLAGCESRLQDSQKPKSPEKLNVLRKDSKSKEKEQSRKQKLPEVVEPANKPDDCLSTVSSPKECSCDYIVCSCHQSPEKLRRCSSESRLSSEKVLEFEGPRKKKARSRSCSPQSVRTLNYFGCGNVYESKQQSSVRVTHHSRSPQRTEELLSNAEQEVPVSKLSIEELKKRTDERSAKALRKERLKRDFQQLINNLKKITQEKSVISSKTKGKLRVFSSERDILTRNESKQKKLNDAFEKLPHSLKSRKTQNTDIQQPDQLPTNNSSPPTLNLALCHTNVTEDEEVYTSRPTMSHRLKHTQSSPGVPSGSPNVLVDRDSSGDVHITVKVSEVLGRRPKSSSPSSGRRPQSSSPSSGSSYLSPPKNLTPSQEELIGALLIQVNKKGIGDEMKKYIRKLLNMSREKIEKLHALHRSGSGHKSPGRSRSTPSHSPLLDEEIDRDLNRLNELAEIYAEKVNTLVNMYEQMSSPSTSPYVDPIRAPPRETAGSPCPPTPRSMRPTPPTTRRGICPPAAETPGTLPRPTRRATPSSSGSGSSADTMELMFGGIPGVPVPTSEELDRRRQLAATVPSMPSPPPADWDMETFFQERRQRILEAGEEPSRTSSSPGGGVSDGVVSGGGGQEDWVKIDTSFDMSALQFPLNSEKLKAVREKLADICNDQYREVLEELQKDTCTDQLQLGKILEQAMSDPFLDPNATLAPIEPVEPWYAGSEWTSQHDTSPPDSPHSLAFSRTGRTPPVDKTLPTGLWEEGLTNSEPLDMTNIQNLLLLAKSQERFNSSQST